MIKKLNYLRRILFSYLIANKSNLSFWHGKPQVNKFANYNKIGQYYMCFHYKAKYNANLDKDGIPMLNYHGKIGLQYNPIAISQWSLGNYNLWKDTSEEKYYINFIKGADWLINNLSQNSMGVFVWMHYFDWDYKETLLSPWYSGLSQGQGLSVLVRAYNETNNDIYKKAMEKIYVSFQKNISEGGVIYIDDKNDLWIEEYIVKDPTHILNGFIWSLWGVYDYWLLTKNENIYADFEKFINTIYKNIKNYDIGYWSLYELSNLKIMMRSSLFYHQLHIVQLNILYKMTNKEKFNIISKKWNNYLDNKINIFKAVFMKIIFKFSYY